ncbi:MAG: LmbE family protein [Candidatus Saccharibacteria bacterium]|nr:LmbE family protein [Candidatus Saccharibacteria bacterium]
MKKIIIGIFAHPDDESFGPAGTLLMEAKSGTDVHLVTLTAGDAGMNPDNQADLAAVRLEEWKKAGSLIGAKSMHFLGYKDGMLSNIDMVSIGEQLIEYIMSLIAAEPADTAIELMSMDLGGVTGHIDHIVAGRSACFAFYRLREDDARFSRIRLWCLSEKYAPHLNTSWLFMEAGHPASDIGEIVDATAYQAELRAIVQAHHTQRADGDSHLRTMGDALGMNYFIVKS